MILAEGVLESTALITGVAGVVYGSWYSEIAQAKSVEVTKFDRSDTLRQVEAALWPRALPLAVTMAALVVALIPPAVSIVAESSQAVFGSAWTYAPAAACFLIAFVTLLGLTAHVTRDAICLFSLMKQLKTDIH